MFQEGFWQEILTAAASQSELEWVGTIANIVYVVLAARGNRWCWLFGGVGAIAFFVVLSQVRLFSDASLQVFYLAMAIYGWVNWNAHRARRHVSILRMNYKQHLWVIVIGCIAGALLGLFWVRFDAAFPWIDGFTTTFSILATILVARRFLENWLYWIAIDVVSIWVYLEKDLNLIALLFVLYCGIAMVGYYSWKRVLIKNPDQEYSKAGE